MMTEPVADTYLAEALREFVIAHCRERAVIQRCVDAGDGNVSAADAMALNAAKVQCDRAANRVLAIATAFEAPGDVLPFVRPEGAAPDLIVDSEHVPQVRPIEEWPHNADGTVQPPGPEVA